MQIIIIDNQVYVFTWADGLRTRRKETLLEQARKSEEDLLRVCLWLEKHGEPEEAIHLMERLLA